MHGYVIDIRYHTQQQYCLLINKENFYEYIRCYFTWTWV